MILDTSFSCNLMSVMTLNILVLRKHWLIFEIWHYFILFLSTSNDVSVKIGRNQFPLDYCLMSFAALCATFGLFVLILHLFNFLSITAYIWG